MKNLSYRSAWYSPRGFANEGVYIYGTLEEMSRFFNDRVAGDTNCEWSLIKHHKSEETALNRCKKDANADIRRHKSNAEISAIGVESVSEYYAER